MIPRRPTRRRWLRWIGAGAATALAGCAEFESGSETETARGGRSGEGTGEPTPANRGTTAADMLPSSTAERTSTAVADETETDDARPAPPTDARTPAATDTGTASPSDTPTATPVHAGYDTAEVRAVSPEGAVLGSVTAAVADTPNLRYLGLSDTGSLPPDRGMLFVYPDVDDRTFVMREMDFGIDIVYAEAAGRITRIHHAPAPGPDEDGGSQRYPGRGQYVLETNYEWTTEHGVEAGDYLEFDL